MVLSLVAAISLREDDDAVTLRASLEPTVSDVLPDDAMSETDDVADIVGESASLDDALSDSAVEVDVGEKLSLAVEVSATEAEAARIADCDVEDAHVSENELLEDPKPVVESDVAAPSASVADTAKGAAVWASLLAAVSDNDTEKFVT